MAADRLVDQGDDLFDLAFEDIIGFVPLFLDGLPLGVEGGLELVQLGAVLFAILDGVLGDHEPLVAFELTAQLGFELVKVEAQLVGQGFEVGRDLEF